MTWMLLFIIPSFYGLFANYGQIGGCTKRTKFSNEYRIRINTNLVDGPEIQNFYSEDKTSCPLTTTSCTVAFLRVILMSVDIRIAQGNTLLNGFQQIVTTSLQYKLEYGFLLLWKQSDQKFQRRWREPVGGKFGNIHILRVTIFGNVLIVISLFAWFVTTILVFRFTRGIFIIFFIAVPAVFFIFAAIRFVLTGFGTFVFRFHIGIIDV